MSEVFISLWRGPMSCRPMARSMREIAEEVARSHGVGIKDLIGPDKRAVVVRARHEAWVRIREETRNSTTRIGQFFGDRDHSTVVQGCKAYARRMSG